ncbi:MAG: phosphoribosylanthranilate isomerase [Agathobacter sp.]|nr:phosphoribosylanthranilate isomerase [Agathobacter sp.]
MTKIKICGLRRIEDIKAVNSCLPDYGGFVFAKGKRTVSEEEAKVLREALSPEIVPVGVFVNAPAEQVAGLLNEKVIDIAQLHGDEDEAYMKTLRSIMKRGQLIKALRAASPECLKQGDGLDVDYLLFDAFSQEGYGGTGETFDWSWIKDVKKPFFLAGGISSENVEKAIERVSPFAVDVSSSVETAGWKDRDKIIEIVNKVKRKNQTED